MKEMTLEEQVFHYKTLSEVKSLLIKAQDEHIENLKKMLANAKIYI